MSLTRSNHWHTKGNLSMKSKFHKDLYNFHIDRLLWLDKYQSDITKHIIYHRYRIQHCIQLHTRSIVSSKGPHMIRNHLQLCMKNIYRSGKSAKQTSLRQVKIDHFLMIFEQMYWMYLKQLMFPRRSWFHKYNLNRMILHDLLKFSL